MMESLVNGDISPEDHDQLQHALKKDAEARAIFRERMDLEASLRTWALEDSGLAPDGQNVALSNDSTDQKQGPRSLSSQGAATTQKLQMALIVLSAVAMIAFLSSPWLAPDRPDDPELAVEERQPQSREQTSSSLFVGVIEEQDCEWESEYVLSDERFQTGTFSLNVGIAKLSFDSGTDVVLEAPCEFEVTSADSARLLAGNVFVNVTEVSNGFTLHTPEAEIIDEGTEYAVALSEDSTEVHVFDGSVIWISETGGEEVEDRIEAGEAKLYSRSDPTTPKRIPFGQRQFVRRLEADIKARSGDALIAYDGFENLAGHLRRGRSGFGWSGGWQSGRRGRGQLAEVVETPDGVVFGLDRTDRRQLELANGSSIRRSFEQPLTAALGETYFVSMLIEQFSTDAARDHSLRIALEPESAGRQRRSRPGVSFGITSDGFPFINTGQRVEKVAPRTATGDTCLCVIKLSNGKSSGQAMLRLYQPGEAVEITEPAVWTVSATTEKQLPLQSVNLSAGSDAVWRVDELRVGTHWDAVTQSINAD